MPGPSPRPLLTMELKRAAEAVDTLLSGQIRLTLPAALEDLLDLYRTKLAEEADERKALERM
jgi:hypothetical protein